MPSHARPKASKFPRALLRAGLFVAATGAALGTAGAASAATAEPAATAAEPIRTPVGELDGAMLNDPTSTVTGALPHVLGGALGPVKHLRPNPLAGTGVDPLSNSVGTQVADLPAVGTQLVTQPLADGAAVDELPLVKSVAGLLPG
ncbi:hypothetical protein [Streptomyces sp. TP-A0874]|uniref:hypothetical protein n=1 Tax=Streptomyces sp. TP-A0874 TaxID=549819 RepID=UPI000853DFF8|nr:hypothetical protein [Streptomyces sp. TP-A0874]